MAVMLNMKDAADGFPSHRNLFLNFPPYYQTIAITVSIGLLWHVSCDVFYEQKMSTVVLSAGLALLAN
jgi:hypothetical protein